MAGITQPTLAHGLEFLYAWPSLFFGVLILALGLCAGVSIVQPADRAFCGLVDCDQPLSPLVQPGSAHVHAGCSPGVDSVCGPAQIS